MITTRIRTRSVRSTLGTQFAQCPARRSHMTSRLLALAASFALVTPLLAGEPTADDVIKKAAAYLKSTQDKSGGWSTDKTPGVTGVVLAGLLKSGAVTAKDPMAEKALQYIESLVNEEKKHIAGKGDVKAGLQNYVTSINVLALVAANRSDKYKA